MLAQLRLAATRHACFEPFVAWWTLVRRAQRDKQRAGKEEAEHAQRRRRLATDRHEEQAARVARLDRSLRRFGARSQLAARFGLWRQAAVFQMLAPAVWSWQARRWLRRLRRAADARRLYVARLPPSVGTAELTDQLFERFLSRFCHVQTSRKTSPY